MRPVPFVPAPLNLVVPEGRAQCNNGDFGNFGNNGLALFALAYMLGRNSGPRPMYYPPQVWVIDGSVKT